MTKIILTTKNNRHGVFINNHTESRVCAIISCYAESLRAWIDEYDIDGQYEISPGCARIDFDGHDDVFNLLCESFTGLAATCPESLEASVINYDVSGGEISNNT